jgi:hypothetical protein
LEWPSISTWPGPEEQFGSREYAAEELIVELGAAFLCAEFGFDGNLRHAGYLASWIELLKADKRAFFTAASRGSQAVFDCGRMRHAKSPSDISRAGFASGCQQIGDQLDIILKQSDGLNLAFLTLSLSFRGALCRVYNGC